MKNHIKNRLLSNLITIQSQNPNPTVDLFFVYGNKYPTETEPFNILI